MENELTQIETLRSAERSLIETVIREQNSLAFEHTLTPKSRYRIECFRDLIQRRENELAQIRRDIADYFSAQEMKAEFY